MGRRRPLPLVVWPVRRLWMRLCTRWGERAVAVCQVGWRGPNGPDAWIGGITSGQLCVQRGDHSPSYPQAGRVIHRFGHSYAHLAGRFPPPLQPFKERPPPSPPNTPPCPGQPRAVSGDLCGRCGPLHCPQARARSAEKKSGTLLAQIPRGRRGPRWRCQVRRNATTCRGTDTVGIPATTFPGSAVSSTWDGPSSLFCSPGCLAPAQTAA